MTRPRSIAIADLSYLFKVQWSVQGRDAAPGAAAQATLDRLATIRESVEHVVVCCDAPPYRRKLISDSYKGTRDKPTEEETAQKKWLMDRLVKDGYQIAKVKGYEADDIIGRLALEYAWCKDVRIVASDKDCAQCVTETCRMYVPAVGSRPEEIRGPAEIKAKYGVEPKDMGLWIALVGDKSDTIKGVPGVGEKRATQLIADCTNLTGIAEALASLAEDPNEKPSAMWKAIAEHWETLVLATKLTRLETDVPLDAEALLVRKQPEPLVQEDELELPEDSEPEWDEEPPANAQPPAGFIPFGKETSLPKADAAGAQGAHSATVATATLPGPFPVPDAEFTEPAKVQTPKPEPRKLEPIQSEAIVVTSAPSWELSLQPRSASEAMSIAKHLYNSRHLSAYGTPEGVFNVILMGRELGIGMQAALNGFFIVEGKPYPSAKLVRGLVQRHRDCEYLVCTHADENSATWATKHRVLGELQPYTYTLERARKAGMFDGKNKHNWTTKTQEMIEKTACVKACWRWYAYALMGLPQDDEYDAPNG